MEFMSNAPATPTPPISPERLKLIRQVSNRLFIALGVLLLIFIPAGFLVYWKLFAGAVPLMALAVGFFGGLVGLQKRLRRLPDEDLMLMAQSWVYTCLSPLVGGILASLTYILFVSGLLSGDLFPKFVADKGAAATDGLAALFAIHGQGTDYAKLIFWCFLAGYSERFVTDLLEQFEGRTARG